MRVKIKEIMNRDFKEQNAYFLPMCDSMDFLKSVMYYVAWTYECFF